MQQYATHCEESRSFVSASESLRHSRLDPCLIGRFLLKNQGAVAANSLVAIRSRACSVALFFLRSSRALRIVGTFVMRMPFVKPGIEPQPSTWHRNFGNLQILST